MQQRPEKADALLDRVCSSLSTAERRRCQSLFFGVLRNLRLLRAAFDPFVKKKPRARFRACCEIAVFELLDADAGGRHPAKIIHHAVEWAKSHLSPGEARALNAILRRAQTALPELTEQAPAAIRLSHPDWLAKRWTGQFGETRAQALMEWNQQPPPVYARWRHRESDPYPFLEASDWEGFYTFPTDHWSDMAKGLRSGIIFIQDPSTRLAGELLAVKPGEQVLDLCAAPGGKSLLLAEALGEDPTGRLVCVEKSGERVALLDENLSKLNTGSGPCLELLQADILEMDDASTGQFDAVLLDAPCSNTGVLRRRPDLRWRLGPDSACEAAELQFKLLCKTAAWVRPGGRIAYSTCSIEHEENEGVVSQFLQHHANFSLRHSVLSIPDQSGHDGAGVHLLVKQ